MSNDSGKGWTRYVTLERFEEYCKTNDQDLEHIQTALWGTERTNGIVKDIHEVKMWIKFLGVMGGFVSPIITALIIKYLIGGV
jgi:hypothetical protein